MQTPLRSPTPGAICCFSHTERQTALNAHTQTKKKNDTIRRHEIANTFTQRRQMETVWRCYSPAQINMKYSQQDCRTTFFLFSSISDSKTPHTCLTRPTILRAMMRCKLCVLLCVCSFNELQTPAGSPSVCRLLIGPTEQPADLQHPSMTTRREPRCPSAGGKKAQESNLRNAGPPV